jgi:glucose-1-phosphate thymidylyltransferase
METRGIILAGGRGTRLWPLTHVTSKQLLPVYDKPMIYYPLATLMASKIRKILIITTSEDQIQFKQLLGDGTRFGIELDYQSQPSPNGIAEALILGEDFLQGSRCALILGDNIFYGTSKLTDLTTTSMKAGGTIFAHEVSDPNRYGVVEVDSQNNVINIIEKPKNPKSNLAVTGLYIYDSKASEMAKSLVPSARGELEITDLNCKYLADSSLNMVILEKESIWLDAGTIESLHDASSLVKAVQERQGIKIACLEEIAFQNNWLTTKEIFERIKLYPNSRYSHYLASLGSSNSNSLESK